MSRANCSGSSGVRLTVTSTSALSRGTPYAMTACAPNTYHRPQRDRTGDSAARSSRAAGWIGTAEQGSYARVRQQIGMTVIGVRPFRIDRAGLAAELVGDAEGFTRPQPSDPCMPVVVLGVTRRAPVA